MVLVLKKEVVKTNNVEHEDTGKYRQLLVRTLHTCSVKFPDVASAIIPVVCASTFCVDASNFNYKSVFQLIEFLSDQNELASADVLVFIREAIQRFDQLRPLIISKLLDTFPTIKAVKIHRAALWILGEYCTSKEDIQNVMTIIRQSLGDVSGCLLFSICH
jgi:coatomer subunit beta